MSHCDFRSDTVTSPTPEMIVAMTASMVGDDVFQDDPTVNLLEEKVARLVGHEAALFCCTGTMANQIALTTHAIMKTSEVSFQSLLCHRESHVFIDENAGAVHNARIQPLPIVPAKNKWNNNFLSAADIRANAITENDWHMPLATIASFEVPMHGNVMPFEQLEEAVSACCELNLLVHMDGARIWNACAALNKTPADFGALCDSMNLCFSKGMGCPVGSVLTGTKEFIDKARWTRKLLGGGWRQAGFLAGALIFVLEQEWMDMRRKDHHHAHYLYDMLHQNNSGCFKHVVATATNMVFVEFKEGTDTRALQKQMNALKWKLIIPCDKNGQASGKLRLVTHLHHTEKILEEFATDLITMTHHVLV